MLSMGSHFLGASGLGLTFLGFGFGPAIQPNVKTEKVREVFQNINDDPASPYHRALECLWCHLQTAGSLFCMSMRDTWGLRHRWSDPYPGRVPAHELPLCTGCKLKKKHRQKVVREPPLVITVSHWGRSRISPVESLVQFSSSSKWTSPPMFWPGGYAWARRPFGPSKGL